MSEKVKIELTREDVEQWACITEPSPRHERLAAIAKKALADVEPKHTRYEQTHRLVEPKQLDDKPPLNWDGWKWIPRPKDSPEVGTAAWAEEQFAAENRVRMPDFPAGKWLYAVDGKVMSRLADGRVLLWCRLGNLAPGKYELYQEGPPDGKPIVGLKFLDPKDGGGIASQEWLDDTHSGAHRFFYKPEGEWLGVPGKGCFLATGAGSQIGHWSLFSIDPGLDYTKFRLVFVEAKQMVYDEGLKSGLASYRWVRILPEPCPERLPRDLVEWIRDCKPARDRLSPEQQAMILGKEYAGSYWWAKEMARQGKPVVHTVFVEGGKQQAVYDVTGPRVEFERFSPHRILGWSILKKPTKTPTDVVWVTEGAKLHSFDPDSCTAKSLFDEFDVIRAPVTYCGDLLFEAIAFRRAHDVGIMFVCWPKEMQGQGLAIAKHCNPFLHLERKGKALQWHESTVSFAYLVVGLKRIAKEIEDKYGEETCQI